MRDPEIPLNQALNLVELSLMYTLRDDKVSALRGLCRHDTQSGRTYSHTLQVSLSRKKQINSIESNGTQRHCVVMCIKNTMSCATRIVHERRETDMTKHRKEVEVTRSGGAGLLRGGLNQNAIDFISVVPSPSDIRSSTMCTSVTGFSKFFCESVLLTLRLVAAA